MEKVSSRPVLSVSCSVQGGAQLAAQCSRLLEAGLQRRLSLALQDGGFSTPGSPVTRLLTQFSTHHVCRPFLELCAGQWMVCGSQFHRTPHPETLPALTQQSGPGDDDAPAQQLKGDVVVSFETVPRSPATLGSLLVTGFPTGTSQRLVSRSMARLKPKKDGKRRESKPQTPTAGPFDRPLAALDRWQPGSSSRERAANSWKERNLVQLKPNLRLAQQSPSTTPDDSAASAYFVGDSPGVPPA